MDKTFYFDAIKAETDKAICLMLEVEWASDGGPGDVAINSKNFWMPKSQVTIDREAKKCTAPAWLIRKSGLAEYTVD
jgi:hypothetical protein